MKSIIAIIAIAFVVLVQSGCTTRTGVSFGHDGHSHGVGVKGSTENGVSVGARTY
jgi:preprotein translocase subunit SecG